MEPHEQRLRVNPHVLGGILISRGVEPAEALNFDISFIPSESALPKGVYLVKSGNPSVMTTSGGEVTLRDKVLEFHVAPSATPSLSMSKFLLLHETGHMYRDVSGEGPRTFGYQSQEFVDRVRLTGKIGTSVFAAIAAGYLLSSGIDSEPLRTIIDTITIPTSILAGVCMPGMTMPREVAWIINAEEWRMHVFALRNWQTEFIHLAPDYS